MLGLAVPLLSERRDWEMRTNATLCCVFALCCSAWLTVRDSPVAAL